MGFDQTSPTFSDGANSINFVEEQKSLWVIPGDTKVTEDLLDVVNYTPAEVVVLATVNVQRTSLLVPCRSHRIVFVGRSHADCLSTARVGAPV